MTKNKTVLWALSAATFVVCCVVLWWFFGWGGVAVELALTAVVAAALVRRRRRRAAGVAVSPSEPAEAPVRPAGPRSPVSDANLLAEKMLLQGRYALLLRPQIKPNLTEEQLQLTSKAFAKAMAETPGGPMIVGVSGDVSEVSFDQDKPDREMVQLDGYFLDRYPVTNRHFQEFVDADGYEEENFWNPEVWLAVPDFVDGAGCLGPRFWSDGTFPAGEEQFPVVGVSWYEALAFARWVGKRLPSNREWEKAGAWPVQLAAGTLLQRKYPWSGAMDRQRANIWDAGPGRTAAVTEFSSGVSLGGVHQLVGNVWEWTDNDFGSAPQHSDLLLPTPMKSIRGGAFDTYFDNQATCQYESGENPMSRKHNIGIRCALSAVELECPNDEAADARADPSNRSAANSEVTA